MRFLTLRETGQRLRRSRRSIYDLLEAGELHAVKMGGRTIIIEEEILRFERELPAAIFRLKPRKARASKTVAAVQVDASRT